MSDDLCYLTALEATRLYSNKELSPVDLMTAVIERSERVEPVINAFSHRFFDEAMEEARAAESRYANGKPKGPLDGLPVAIKDEVDVKGQHNTEGSLIYEDRVAAKDAVLVQRLRDAGAIFHARTTCPEFCTLWNTHSRLFGVTRNPWNNAITPGGSSGGSGASLAAGTTTLATGSDIGGSIRFPASMCGIVGFKPPYGRVPETYVPFNMESYCANGPMARTVADTALMQNVMSGVHPLDAASALPEVEIPLSFDSDLKGIRIAHTMDFGYLDVEDDVMRNTFDAIERLKDRGAEIVDADLKWPSGIERAYYAHMDPLCFSGIADHLEAHRDLMCDYNIQIAEEALERRRLDPNAFFKAVCIEAEMYESFGQLMESYDAFVCPTVTTTQLVADFNPAHDEYVSNGKVQKNDLGLSTCHFFNMMGRCPAISVPSGIADNGVPTGLQIAARAYDDIAVFRIAAVLEQAMMFPRHVGDINQ